MARTMFAKDTTRQFLMVYKWRVDEDKGRRWIDPVTQKWYQTKHARAIQLARISPPHDVSPIGHDPHPFVSCSATHYIATMKRYGCPAIVRDYEHCQECGDPFAVHPVPSKWEESEEKAIADNIAKDEQSDSSGTDRDRVRVDSGPDPELGF